MRETISRATIVRDGELQGAHTKLSSAVEAWRSGSANPAQKAVPRIDTTSAKQGDGANVTGAAGARKKKRVLLLGSGLVAGPAVEVFAARSDVSLAIGKYRFPFPRFQTFTNVLCANEIVRTLNLTK